MTEITVTLPRDLADFVADAVGAGRFADPADAAVHAFLLLREQTEWRHGLAASIEKAAAAGERDGFIPLDEVLAEMRARIDRISSGDA